MPEANEKTIPVRVALRIRPLQPKEKCEGCQECIVVTPGEPQVVIGEQKAFTYDHVFSTASHQAELYDQAVSPLLEGFFAGYNATVLAYGQTGSGKTFSMGTNLTMNSIDDDNVKGVIPRVISAIFESIEDRKEKTEFLVKASFLEIHNEEIQDLLGPGVHSSDDRLAVREDSDGGIRIAGLQEVTVTSVREMFNLLERGSACRVTASTAMNRHSSRSHAIFTIAMHQQDKGAVQSETKKAKFHLVDLAGSERAKKTLAQGERFKEGVNINKGLLSLGNVISALSDENRKSNAHVPYRDSKLTRLLQDSLGGNSNTVMIACVSPADNSFDETLNTLRYADRARQIKNKPIVNRDPAAAELAKLRQQVQMLQLQLLQGQTINGNLPGDVTQVNSDGLIIRVKELEAENETLSSELQSSVEQCASVYEKLLLVEISRDKMLQKFGELKFNLGDTVLAADNLELAANETNTGFAAELQKKLHEFEETMNISTQVNQIEKMEGNCDKEQPHEVPDGAEEPDSPSPAESSFSTQHALRQAELGRQLKDLTKTLAAKEELASAMAHNDSRIAAMRKQYEETVRELEREISKLENEKAEICSRLAGPKTSAGVEMGSKARARIKELEGKIQELKKKQVENQKLLVEKQQRDKTIAKLNADIQGIKSTRVKLMRQMKDEAEKFRTMKAEKEKEILQLKQQGRKRQFEYKKLETMHSKQQAVLKRKTEEVAAAQRRLKEALRRQKEANDKRANQQQLHNRQMENLGPRMRSWLSYEVEVKVSVAQARETLGDMIEDRKVLSHQLADLRGRLQDAEGQPPAKKRVPGSDDSPETSGDVSKKILSLDTELKFRSEQINELQRKIMGAEQGDKGKFRWSNIHTMAEAKAGLQALLEMTVSAKVSEMAVTKDKDDASSSLQEMRSSMESLLKEREEEIVRVKEEQERTVVQLQKQHEEKVTALLKELSQEVESLRSENHGLNQQLSKLMAVFERDSPTPDGGVEDTETGPEVKVVKPQRSGRPSIFPAVADPAVGTGKSKSSPSYVYIDDDEQWEESDGEDDCVDKDPDWRKTPMRLQKSNRISNEQTAEGPTQGCSCKGKCMTSACSCRKANSSCCAGCQCRPIKCANRQTSSTSSSDSSPEDLPLSEVEPVPARKALVELNKPMKAGKAKKGVDLAAGSNDTENKSHMSDPAHAGPRLASGGKKQPSAFSKPSAAKRTHKTHSSASASSDEDPGRAKLNKGRTVGAKLICTPKAPRRVLGPIGRKNMMMRQQGLQPQEASQPKTSVTLKRKRKLMRPAVEATLFPSSGSGN